MYLPVIWRDAVDWPSINVPTSMANRRACLWVIWVQAMPWG